MNKQNGIVLAGEILIIISAVGWCFTIIGMAWGIPMIIGCIKRINGEKEVTVGHCVVSILFYGIIGGILSLVGSQSDTQGQTNQEI